MARGYNGSKTDIGIRDLWQTPAYLFNWYNKQYNFTHDIAASHTNHLCPEYFTKEDDALKQEWGKCNFLNPPYSDITPWVTKAIQEQHKGNTTVMLIPADTSVAWFKLAWDNAFKIELISGRISFVNAQTGKAVNGNNKGSVVFIFDPRAISNLSLPYPQLLDRREMQCLTR